jgi:hypothetical protein
MQFWVSIIQLSCSLLKRLSLLQFSRFLFRVCHLLNYPLRNARVDRKGNDKDGLFKECASQIVKISMSYGSCSIQKGRCSSS